jgi:predicted secreted protein
MIFSYIVVLTCVWWIVFYMILPFGNEITIKPEVGHADSAPTKPRLGIKVIITSVISIILTMVIVYLIDHGYLKKMIDLYIDWLSVF